MEKNLTILFLAILLGFSLVVKSVFAQESPSVLYIPLIGVTSVPDPLALPNGSGNVTYNYAVKNFLTEVDLHDINVVDDSCSPVTFVEGDDNGDHSLNYSETWRYRCTTKISTTTQSVVTATGMANGIMATHNAYATVMVGSKNPAPLVSIINITKIAYPLSLPKEGGDIVFTYRVNNPGVVPLSNVSVTDDKCIYLSGKLGDTNGNNLLDINEVWVYTCKANLTETTTNTATVTAFANGFKATNNYTLTVNVAQASPDFPNTGPNLNSDPKMIAWEILVGILVGLIMVLFLGIFKKHEN